MKALPRCLSISVMKPTTARGCQTATATPGLTSALSSCFNAKKLLALHPRLPQSQAPPSGPLTSSTHGFHIIPSQLPITRRPVEAAPLRPRHLLQVGKHLQRPLQNALPRDSLHRLSILLFLILPVPAYADITPFPCRRLRTLHKPELQVQSLSQLGEAL